MIEIIFSCGPRIKLPPRWHFGSICALNGPNMVFSTNPFSEVVLACQFFSPKFWCRFWSKIGRILCIGVCVCVCVALALATNLVPRSPRMTTEWWKAVLCAHVNPARTGVSQLRSSGPLSGKFSTSPSCNIEMISLWASSAASLLTTPLTSKSGVFAAGRRGKHAAKRRSKVPSWRTPCARTTTTITTAHPDN